jgi:hypothetical protein
MIMKKYWPSIVLSCVLAIAIAIYYKSNEQPSFIDQIEKVDTTRSLTDTEWISVQRKLNSKDANEQLAGLSLVQSTLVPEQVAYGRKVALQLKDSKDATVRASAITTLYRLKTDGVLPIIDDALRNDSSPYVRDIMKALSQRHKTKPLF